MSKVKVLGPPVGYTDLLDHAITEKLEKRRAAIKAGETDNYFPLRPSAAGFCGRRLAYSLMEYHRYADYDIPIYSPRTERIFEMGHAVEYSILKQFGQVKIVRTKYKQAPCDCLYLEPLTPKGAAQLIEGSCDACFMSETYKAVMDVKSVKDGFSKFYPTRWTETLQKLAKCKTAVQLTETAFYVDDIEAFLEEYHDSFLADNIFQLNLYAMSDFIRLRGIDHAVIYKYNKNDSSHYELRFKPSEALAQKVVEKFNLVNRCVSEEKPEDVPRDSGLGSQRCAFCDYSKLCYPNKNSLKEYFKTWPKKKWPTDIDRIQEEGLPELFEQYEINQEATDYNKKLEEKILFLLENHKVQKVKLANGHVYEVKFLKTPKEHLELRRTKI